MVYISFHEFTTAYVSLLQLALGRISLLQFTLIDNFFNSLQQFTSVRNSSHPFKIVCFSQNQFTSLPPIYIILHYFTLFSISLHQSNHNISLHHITRHHVTLLDMTMYHLTPFTTVYYGLQHYAKFCNILRRFTSVYVCLQRFTPADIS